MKIMRAVLVLMICSGCASPSQMRKVELEHERGLLYLEIKKAQMQIDKEFKEKEMQLEYDKIRNNNPFSEVE